jgi:hypothetical protein
MVVSQFFFRDPADAEQSLDTVFAPAMRGDHKKAASHRQIFHE